MNSSLTALRLVVLCITLPLAVLAETKPEPFEIKEGERVLLIGDTLIEREGDYGYLETRMHEQFPDRRFIVRNLGFSADTPLGVSRASFDKPEKGIERIKEQLALVKPTVAILGYGMAASLDEMTYRSGDPALNPDVARYGADHGVEKFKRDLSQLMDLIEKSSADYADAADLKKDEDAAASEKNLRKSAKSADKKQGGGVRFVLLSPIRHEDLRAIRPGLPDPAEHNKLLEQYSKVIEELAKERGATTTISNEGNTRFVKLYGNLGDLTFKSPPTPEAERTARENEAKGMARFVPNGIHPSEAGYALLAEDIGFALGWKRSGPAPRPETINPTLRAAVIRKNELFFHRWRPANETYLFGFRKHEQGRNAAEIPQFDPLIEAAEAEIDRLKKALAPTTAAAPVQETKPAAKPAAPTPEQTPFPIPAFTLDDNLEISVFAENPLLEKPTQMNWDARGRLWVASSSMYPMIAPGEEANDKILILEDVDHDGKAEKSTVFADGLLLPTGVVPDLGNAERGMRNAEREKSADAKSFRDPSSEFRVSDACYVGASTQLLHFSNPDPATGKATERRIILSGFGTEDTHHIIHTLHWGPDGRLYFHQSVYIHSHIETPWGVVRANAGAVYAYDPRTERVEVFCKGLWNSWGQQEDRFGQMFLTDGAGSTGVSWAFPGAVWNPSEGSRRQAPQISPGGYPKFAGLELIDSPAFPDDWQGNAITCDFRAHRIVRFGINDLSIAESGSRNAESKDKAADAAKDSKQNAQSADASSIRNPQSAIRNLQAGYATKEMPDVLRTSDVAFRPIDVRLGPDGALYVADWSNPVINHGEVDFRDPRRDHHHGRIWRITYKGRPVVKWESLVEKANRELLDNTLKANHWEAEQSRWTLQARGNGPEPKDAKLDFLDTASTGREPIGFASSYWFHDLPDSIGKLQRGWIAQAIDYPSFQDAKDAENLIANMDPRCGSALVRITSASNEAYFKTALSPEGKAKPTNGTAKADSKEWETEKNDLLQHVTLFSNPRVRLEALRALARIPTARSAELVLDAAVPIENRKSKIENLPDPWLDFAAWQSINDLAKPWSDAVLSGAWKAEGREKQLEYALNAIDPAYSAPVIAALLKDRPIPRDGAGPWIELIGKGGSPAELRRLFDAVVATESNAETQRGGANAEGKDSKPSANSVNSAPLRLRNGLEPAARQRALNALLDAARTRNARPDGDLAPIGKLFDENNRDVRAAAARLAGAWHLTAFVPRLVELASLADDAGLRGAGFEGLREMGHQETVDALKKLVAADKPLVVRRGALAPLAIHNRAAMLAALPSVLGAITKENEALETWRALLSVGGVADALEKNFPQDLPAPVLASGLKAAREKGHQGALLAKVIEPLAHKAPGLPRNIAGEIAGMVSAVKQGGDPSEGEMIYRRIGCVQCHSIGGAGGKLGPDLTSIGASAPMDYLVESVYDPAAKVKEGYHAFAFTMKDGSQMTGIPTHETATEQFIRPGPGPEVALVKANIVKREIVGSLMPPGLADALSFVEKRSLFAFLGQLGRPGPFDASKGNVARVWWLYPAADAAKAMKAEKLDEAVPAYTLVDGRLVRELLQPLTDAVAKNAGEFYAVARCEAPQASRSPLAITGATESWLDGKPLAAGGEISAGAHIIVVKLGAKHLPEALKVEGGGVRFVGE